MADYYAEINIKEDMPLATESIDSLKRALTRYKNNRTHFVVIIHGYGSTGKGGVIRQKARSYLMAQKAKGAIKKVVFGEEMTIFNPEALALKQHCKSLDCYMETCNHGITIIEL